MFHLSVRRLGLVLATALLIVIAACGGTGSGTGSGPGVQTPGAAAAAEMIGSRIVIDVRTPGEFAAGHLAGAQNIDVEAGDFGERIAALDPNGAYLVYCRSGRRSAVAAQEMAAAGFTDIVDGGGLADLVAAGAATE